MTGNAGMDFLDQPGHFQRAMGMGQPMQIDTNGAGMK